MNDRHGKLIVAMMATLLLCTAISFQLASSQIGDSSGGEKPEITNSVTTKDDPTGKLSVVTFMQLNAPASSTTRGTPDPNSAFGASVPTVWETFKNSSELYRPNGATPPDWNTNCELPTEFPNMTTAQLQQQFGQTNSTWVHYLSESRMIDGQQIVDANGALIRYDVRCNQPHFDYVANNPSGYQLYNLEGQEKALSDSNFAFDFPTSCVEVKAAWRILTANDDDTRYWTAYGAYYDETGSPKYAKIGLTAFHFITHPNPEWSWFTYEQVDNPTSTFKYFLQQKQEPVGENKTVNPLAAKYNLQIANKAKGTKWEFYRIIGWQDSETHKSGKPVVLANSNIETYFPKTSSCMSCHAMANIGPTVNHRLNFWLTDRSGIQGRVGEIDFQAIANELAPGQTFKQMNYVWSLRQAQSTQGNSSRAPKK